MAQGTRPAKLEEEIRIQAAELERLLPSLMRRMFTLDPEHPANELPVGQLRVCSILQGGPGSMSVIAEELGISISALTQIANRLELAGLVERVSIDDDRRVKNLQLTDEGHRIMRSRREFRVRRAASALSHLSALERERILEAVRTLLKASPPACDSGRDDPRARLQSQ
jgi:DNA-binding MarR family transcriptional regulator